MLMIGRRSGRKEEEEWVVGLSECFEGKKRLNKTYFPGSYNEHIAASVTPLR
jgi:hypothetical protein